jgi:SAM-dependent methyltransferase
MSAQSQPVADIAEIKLNLGCCDNLLEGFINVDLIEPADTFADLNMWWPWPTDSVTEIVAHDILEHLDDKIHSMNEAWRVLKPGGLLSLRVPTTDGRGAFQDPTHRSYWTPHDLLYYVSGCPERERFSKHYGISACFAIVSAGHREVTNEVWYLAAVLEALK